MTLRMKIQASVSYISILSSFNNRMDQGRINLTTNIMGRCLLYRIILSWQKEKIDDFTRNKMQVLDTTIFLETKLLYNYKCREI